MKFKEKFRQSLNVFWNSPTINTWLSYSTKALSLFLVLPLLLSKFNPAEIALWYLFSTVIAIESLADMGFKITFIRMIAYGYGGAEDINTSSIEISKKDDAPNWNLVNRIYSVMKHVYRWITALVFVLLISLGSWSLIKPISGLAVENQTSAWMAWGLIVVVACIKFYGTIYSNYLEGLNKIVIVRRWETLTSIGAIFSSILVLILCKSLFWLVFSNQLWVVINVVRDILLCHQVEEGRFKKLKVDNKFDKVLFKKIWAPAWRSGVAAFMSNGLSNITTIIYAQIGNSVNIASYLLALRVINQIKDVSAAPFYSKIPFFAQLVAKNKIQELTQKAQRGMFLSNMIFVVGAICFGLSAQYILVLVHSKITFISPWLWLTITIAYSIHRYGAMHLQLYNISNHIIGHIADGVSGIIFIITALLLIHKLDLYAIPIGLICGYLGFYAWYAGMHSYKFMQTSFFRFEKNANGIPICILLVYALINLFSNF